VAVATPKTLVWDRDAHTAAKHDLLRRYLEAWTPILLQRFPRVTYAEGFAGPGIYKGGEPGSPVIALETFLARRDLLDAGKRLSMVLIDADRARVQHLDKQLSEALTSHGRPKPATLDIRTQHGECGNVLHPELAKVAAYGQPIFAVLDSFGGPDIPFDLLKAIASNKSSEVLVTFGTAFLTRFGDVTQHQESGDRAFGGTHWRAATSQPPHAKKTFLVDAYRQTLKMAGFAHILTFEMIDEAGHALFLIFGTNGPRGLEKMKDAIWKVDPIAGVSYRDPRDQDQTLLDLVAESDKPSLGRMLLTQLGDRTLDVEALRQYALFETVYRPEHVIPTVRGLIADGALETVPARKGVTKATVVRRTGVQPQAAHVKAIPQTLFDL
jgi:three-Cys-motif partner protein